MPKFRKKPIVVTAIQNKGRGESYSELIEALQLCERPHYRDGDALIIRTLEGDMRADVGDWIIFGIKGEPYPCKPDIFEKTYEPI